LWRDVVPGLTDSGYEVLVPDLRGCGETSKPLETERYAMRELVSDVVAIIEQCSSGPVHLVGHDWGANLAWVCCGVASRSPSLRDGPVGRPSDVVSFGRTGSADQEFGTRSSSLVKVSARPSCGDTTTRRFVSGSVTPTRQASSPSWNETDR
jgi:hypothetical protein